MLHYTENYLLLVGKQNVTCKNSFIMKSIVLSSGHPRRGFGSAKKGNPIKALSKLNKLLCGVTIYLTKKFWYWWCGVIIVYDHKWVWVWLSVWLTAKLSSTSVNN